jgi:hypothetical protein
MINDDNDYVSIMFLFWFGFCQSSQTLKPSELRAATPWGPGRRQVCSLGLESLWKVLGLPGCGN